MQTILVLEQVALHHSRSSDVRLLSLRKEIMKRVSIAIIIVFILIIIIFCLHNVTRERTNVTQKLTFQHPLKPLQILKPIQDTVLVANQCTSYRMQESGPALCGQVETPAALPAPTHDTPPIVEQARPIGTAGDSLDIERGWIYRYLEATEKERQRTAMAHRIDCYFDARRSPMKGLGSYIVTSAERYGHDPRLCAAIAEAESTCGLACFSPNNAWGMLAYRSGFSSWQEGVDKMFDWLFKYNGVCTSAPRNWCEPPDPWRSNVNAVMESI
jgi:hypothetical protein